MDKKYFLFLCAAIAAVSYFFFFKKAGMKKDSNVLVVGTSADYKPFAFVDSKANEIVGFDIDVAREVAHRLDKKIEIKDIPFASLIFGILSGDIDVIAAGMSPTPKRAETVLFSRHYIEPDPFVIISKKSAESIENIQDLNGKKVAVNTGYTAESYLADKDGINLIRLTSPAESMMALQSGAIDAFVCARSVAHSILEQNDSASYDSAVIENTGDGCALAVNKNNELLVDQINTALNAMEQDGTLGRLKEKWKIA